MTRFRDQASAWYLLGDAIQYGFGTGLFAKGCLIFESGDWASYEQDKAYNWQKSEKLTFRLDQKVIEGIIHQPEVFVMTNNMVFEGCF